MEDLNFYWKSNKVRFSASVFWTLNRSMLWLRRLLSLPASYCLWVFILIDHWLYNKLPFGDNKDLLDSRVRTGLHLLNSNPSWLSMSFCNYSQPNILLCSAVERDRGVLWLPSFVIFIEPLSRPIYQTGRLCYTVSFLHAVMARPGWVCKKLESTFLH